MNAALTAGLPAILLAAVAVPAAAAPAPFSPAPSAASTDTSTSMFEVDGVTVILRRLTGSEIVVVQTYLLGGSRQLAPANAGVEALLLDLGSFGTRTYPGRAAAAALARTGSTIESYSGRDWSVSELRTIRSELDSAWAVYADRLIAPEFDVESVALIRDRMYAGVLLAINDPDALVTRFADSVAFSGHPYAIDPQGTEHSLRAMRTSDVQAFHAAQMVKSRLLVVVVGNATRGDLERLIRGTLSTLPAGSYEWSLPPDLPVREASMTIVPRALKTNYILGFFPGPRAGTREHAAFRVATALLGSDVNRVIRQEGKLSYAAYAPFLDRGVAAGGVYVSTTEPEKVMSWLARLMGGVMSRNMPWQAMPYFVSQFSLDFLLDQETYDGQASALARAHLLRGDFRATDAWLAELKQVSPVRVQDQARRYFPAIQYVFMGDTALFGKYMR